MIVDTSAIVAILKDEPEGIAFSKALDEADYAGISAASYLETAIVIGRYRDPVLNAELDELLEDAGIVIVPVTQEQAKIARQAFRDYGRGSGHAANLNFGDCFSYALARTMREPLLYKGDDFSHTDLPSALHP